MSGPSRFSRRALLAVLAASCLVASLPSRAQSPRLLDAPRAAGTIGERYDGFAMVRGGASGELSAIVDQVNRERRAVYADEARKRNVPADAVGRIYAAEIIKSAPAGTWFLNESGQWAQK